MSLPRRGHLKIFLGYASGVGKTYAMFQAARRQQAEGIDVVLASIETEAWPETAALSEGLACVPPRDHEGPGSKRAAMDLDAVLTRRPRLALVDNLAHTNSPPARHTHRYQDVLEMLNAGIDVYTTLNVAHLASLKDVVTQITKVTMKESVPDFVFDEAQAIELIDLAPADLLARLPQRHPPPSTPAEQQLFRPGNLAALRELALRRAADRVDAQMRAYMQHHAIPGPWPATERLLVCISPSPLSERLVRTARRLAARLDAEWFAVYVETPGQARLSAADRERVAETLHLAELLGAHPVTLTGQTVVETLINFAQTRNVTKIVAGKPLRPRWAEFWRGSIVDQLIRHSGDLDVYVISSTAEQPALLPIASRLRSAYSWIVYAQSIGLVALTTLVGFPLRPFIEPTNLVMLYLLAVVIAAIQLGRRPAILASLLSVIAFNFVFVPPYYTHFVADAQFLLTFAGLLVVGLVISTLAAQARDQAKAAQRREAQTTALYDLSRSLAGATEIQQIVQAVVAHVEQVFGGQAMVLLPGASNPKNLKLYPPTLSLSLSEREQTAAEWTFQHGQPAGRGTNTLTETEGIYYPLKTATKVIGVLGLCFTGGQSTLPAEQQRLLESFAGQTAQTIERLQLADEAHQAQLLRETEKLQTALLNSISHDLRTPLASITGSLSSLRDDAAYLDEAARTVLVNNAWEQAERLNNLVGNLLEMTRLEAGAIKVKAELCEVQDLVGVALAQLGNRLEGRELRLEIPVTLPLVPLDFVMMVQVLVNLIDNALKYAPPETPITLRAGLHAGYLQIEVLDEGRGIPAGDVERIFDKFYRGQRSNGVNGTGLGLSISQGIVEAHGGRIRAENRAGGGAAFTVALPINETETTQ